MDKKKILIVSRSFYPESSPRSFRTTELVKEFARQGHDVTLLTTERNYDYTGFIKSFPVRIKSIGPLSWKQPNAKSFGGLGRKFSRLLFLLLEYPNIELMFRLRKILRNYSGYDLMISIAVPHPVHWGVALARTPAHRIAATWVADCGDPFMGNTLESIKPPFYFSYFERLFGKKADYISVPTEGAVNAYYKEFRSKIVVIPQGFNFDDFQVLKEYSPNVVPTFAYAGGLGAGLRSPDRIIDYLLATGKDFHFHIYSKNSSFLENYKQKAPGKLVLHDAVPRDTLLNELAKMDFLLNFDNGSTNQTPSKLIDYALAGRPILNVLAENPNYTVIDEFLIGDYENQLPAPDLDAYDIRNVTAKFLHLIKA